MMSVYGVNNVLDNTNPVLLSDSFVAVRGGDGVALRYGGTNCKEAVQSLAYLIWCVMCLYYI